MKRKRMHQRKGQGGLVRVLFAVFIVTAFLAGPGLAENALADIKSDLEAKIDAGGMGFKEAAEAVMSERLAAGENYEDILAALIAAAEAIAAERGWNVAEAVALVKAGAEKEGLDQGIIQPTTTSTSTSTTTSSTTSTTTTTKESTVSPSS